MTKSLQLLEGRIEDLRVVQGEQDILSGSQRLQGTAVAAGLAASGLAGSAIGSAATLTGSDSVEYFFCRIDEKPIAGAFSKVTFRDGDEVRVAVEKRLGQPDIARAMLRLSDGVLWMPPHCSRGSKAHLRFSVGLAWKIGLALTLLFTPFFWRALHGGDRYLEHLKMIGLIYGVMAVTIALYYSIRFYRQWKPVAQGTDAALQTIGYESPSNVDLSRDSARVSRAKGAKWPYETDGAWIYRSVLPKR